MRSRFDAQLATLHKELTEMGGLCERAIAKSAKALLTGDTALASEVMPLDLEIDQKEHKIETLCLRLLLQQQPVAQDLRQVSAALKMITDMERIGAQAADIAEIVTTMPGHGNMDCAPMGKMARAAIQMVSDSIDAYTRQDLALARLVRDYDDVVDNLFITMKTTLLSVIASNPKDGQYALDLLMIAKYLERIADHATSIAEWVEFSVTGIHKGQLEL